MKNPTKAQVQTVIDTLTRVLPQAQGEDSLCMIEGSLCGTIHCHGGWYFVSKHLDNPTISPEEYKGLDYSEGANLIAEDLGIDQKEKLRELDICEWANKNHEIWGNDGGGVMFASRYAFKSETRRYGARTLKDIVDHWTEVRDRLPE